MTLRDLHDFELALIAPCLAMTQRGLRVDESVRQQMMADLVAEVEPLRAELVAFLDAVRTGNAPAVTGDEGVASLEIAIKCLDVPAGSIAAPLRKGPRAVAS